ncbi:MAG: hypothetical protein R3F43_12295 [bacterium]
MNEADLIFPEQGNIGPASVPTVLAQAAAEAPAAGSASACWASAAA